MINQFQPVLVRSSGYMWTAAVFKRIRENKRLCFVVYGENGDEKNFEFLAPIQGNSHLIGTDKVPIDFWDEDRLVDSAEETIDPEYLLGRR